MGCSFDISSNGRSRQGRRHQTRNLGRKSAGLPGIFIQVAVDRGPRSRLSLALHEISAESRAIGIFNRSYYEEVLVVRVHPEFLAKQKLPPKLVGKEIWSERFEDIRNFEQYLGRNGVVVRKFFLHVSKKEQKRRFLARIDDSQKNWKFSSNDATERDFWDDYMTAYDEMIQETATKHAPWYVVPANNKWFTRVVVAAAVIEALADLDLAYPKVDEDKLKELATAKNKLQ